MTGDIGRTRHSGCRKRSAGLLCRPPGAVCHMHQRRKWRCRMPLSPCLNLTSSRMQSKQLRFTRENTAPVVDFARPANSNSRANYRLLHPRHRIVMGWPRWGRKSKPPAVGAVSGQFRAHRPLLPAIYLPLCVVGTSALGSVLMRSMTLPLCCQRP